MKKVKVTINHDNEKVKKLNYLKGVKTLEVTKEEAENLKAKKFIK